MNDLLQAADAIRRANRQAELFKLAADVLERVGSIEAAEVEAQKRLVVAREALAAAEANVAEVKAGAQTLAQVAAIEADKRVSAAQDKAEALVRDATAEVDRIVAAGKAGRDAITDEAARVGRALTDTNAALAARNAELGEATTKLAAAREAISKLLG